MKREVRVVEVERECPSCMGTGLYVGMGERDGAAVVCHICKGTGCSVERIEYVPFRTRQHRGGVGRVYQTNPGICIGTGNGHTLEEFGGITLMEWEAGIYFPPGSENRQFTCPCWWFQAADYDKKPKWRECNENLGGSFSQCKYFSTKEGCWTRWDKENPQ